MQFLSVLAYIFSTFCFPLRPPTFALPEKTAHLPPSALDAFAIATNGEAFSKETKAEISTFFDGVDKDAAKDVEGGINFAGFEQMYTLQTESDPEETWRCVPFPCNRLAHVLAFQSPMTEKATLTQSETLLPTDLIARWNSHHVLRPPRPREGLRRSPSRKGSPAPPTL